MSPFVRTRSTRRASGMLRAGAACALALGLLAGCGRAQWSGSDNAAELDWARAALARNPALEIVATDDQKALFTVRVKRTGELRTVAAAGLVAHLPDAAGVPEAASSGPPAADAAAGGAPERRTEPEGTDSDSAGPATASAGAEEPSGAAGAGDGQAPIIRAETGEAVGQAPAPGGRVLAAGPGYSISAGTSRGADTATRPGTRVDAAREAPRSVERRGEPIICQGARFLQIDGRDIEFTGDAIVAEQGCELHITNSRILAQGTGVIARAANVHIQNSTVEGGAASIEASGASQIYLRSSRFGGLSRRLDTSVVHDLGGNVWN